MTYVMSDIHGCFDKYEKMLEKINLGDNDTLYILGDVLDRGNGGIKIILDLIPRKNVICLRGNHEHDAYLFLKHFAVPNDGYGADDLTEPFKSWLAFGGEETFNAFLEIDTVQKCRVLAFLKSLSFYKMLEIGGRKYHLSHTLPEYEEGRRIHDAPLRDFVWGEPDYDICYDPDVTFITGHTPTGLIAPDYRGRIWKGNNHIATDCGAAFGGRLGCICLETAEEFYV